KTDSDLAARRLAAWCRSCASGDWSLFHRRLARDGLSFDQVLPRLATVRRRPDAPFPVWTSDAVWIEAALQTATTVAACSTLVPQAPTSPRSRGEVDTRSASGEGDSPSAVLVKAAPLPASGEREARAPAPSEVLFAPVAEQALTSLVADITPRALANLTEGARASLHNALLRELCDLAAPALYERFAATRKERAAGGAAPSAEGETA